MMTQQIYSYLHGKLEHVVATGGDKYEAMCCVKDFLERERLSKIAGRGVPSSKLSLCWKKLGDEGFEPPAFTV